MTRASVTRLLFALAATVSLGACTEQPDRARQLEQLERRYAAVRRAAGDGGGTAATCAAATRVEQAYLAQGDARGYHYWSLLADTECLSAKIGTERRPT